MTSSFPIKKIRPIVKPRIGSPTYGIVLPVSFLHWAGVYVTIRESGTALILESGAKLSSLSNKKLNEKTEILNRFRI